MTAPGAFTVTTDVNLDLVVACPVCPWQRCASSGHEATLSDLLRLAESHAAEHRQEAKR